MLLSGNMAPERQCKAKTKSKNSEEVLLVAQEIKFARILAGNEKKSRDKVLKTLKKWFIIRFDKEHEFKEEDFNRIWKGLFYAIWMSDKPLVQEDLCESVSGILDLFPPEQVKYAGMFLKSGLRTLATEWYGIDQHRMDKFLMLVRRVVRAGFRCASRAGWSARACAVLSRALSKRGLLAINTPPYVRNALGLQLHFADCYLEELAKVSDGEVPEAALTTLLSPFAEYMALGPEARLCGAIKKNIFTYLLRQSSMGQDYEDRRRAWTKMGCPQGGVEALEKIEDSDQENDSDEQFSDNEDSGALDPRAGRVDVVLSTLPVPAEGLLALLRPLRSDRRAGLANRKRVRAVMHQMEEYLSGVYPLRVKEQVGAVLKMPRAGRAARKLHELERRLTASADELALRGLSRKHRKRLLAKTREGLSIVEERAEDSAKEPTPPANKKRRKHAQKKNSINGGWKVEDTAPLKELSKNKENEPEKTEKNSRKKRKMPPTTLQDEIPLKKLKTKLMEQTSKKPDAKPKQPEKQLAQKKPVNLKNKQKNFQKQTKPEKPLKTDNEPVQTTPKLVTPKRVKIVLKNNTIQGPIDYYKSVRRSPNIPFEPSKKPTKTNLKPNSTPSPINPFHKKKLKL